MAWVHSILADGWFIKKEFNAMVTTGQSPIFGAPYSSEKGPGALPSDLVTEPARMLSFYSGVNTIPPNL